MWWTIYIFLIMKISILKQIYISTSKSRWKSNPSVYYSKFWNGSSCYRYLQYTSNPSCLNLKQTTEKPSYLLILINNFSVKVFYNHYMSIKLLFSFYFYLSAPQRLKYSITVSLSICSQKLLMFSIKHRFLLSEFSKNSIRGLYLEDKC